MFKLGWLTPDKRIEEVGVEKGGENIEDPVIKQSGRIQLTERGVDSYEEPPYSQRGRPSGRAGGLTIYPPLQE